MSIFAMIYEQLQAKNKHLKATKISKRAFDMLDNESISNIILDGNTFWFEYSSNASVDNQAMAWLVKYLEQHGYKYLYEVQA